MTESTSIPPPSPPSPPASAPLAGSPLAEEIATRIRRHGPLPFDEVMHAALYDPTHGFYTTGGSAGRRGDFITSVEVGPLFGAVVARALDTWWHELDRPDPFLVIEAGAGTGMLARAVLQAAPACLPALTYVLVEQSAPLRARHADHLEITAAAHALPPPDGPAEHEADARRAASVSASSGRPEGAPAPSGAATGPRFVSLPDLPIGPFVGVVLANELLDNLPVKLLEHDPGPGWCEVRVGLTDDEQAVAEYLVPAAAPLMALAERLVPDPPAGARIPLQGAAAEWVRRAFEVLDRGRVVLIDYADTTPALAARPPHEWLRTYRDHARGAAPLAELGRQDITCEVAIDQLERVRAGLHVESQAEFLRHYGIEELVEEGRQVWHDRASIGDLAAIRGRSRINEAAALLDAEALGAFSVLTWTR